MNWHICHKKKLPFLFIFSTYLPVFLLKFRSWELVGCGIWFPIQRVPTLHTFDGPCYPKNKKYRKKRDNDIQRALLIKIWIKIQGDMSKIWTKKVVFFYDKYVISTIMVDLFYWNSIGSWIPTHKNLLLARFLIRPILDPKFPPMLMPMVVVEATM